MTKVNIRSTQKPVYFSTNGTKFCLANGADICTNDRGYHLCFSTELRVSEEHGDCSQSVKDWLI